MAVKKLLNVMVNTGAVLSAVILLVITAATGVTIFGRFFGWSAPGWIVQFTEYGVFWIPLLGAAWLIRRDQHVNVDIIISRIKPQGKKIITCIHHIMGLLVCIILLNSSCNVWLELKERMIMDLQVIDMPKYIILTVLPVGFFLMAVQFLIKLIETIRRSLPQDSSETVGPSDDF
jgi:TRAP-type C4-dicarboxylate transport system permease small subunit